MTIIQLPQGYYRDLTGTPKTDAVAMFAEFDADFCAKHPSAAKYHRPSWREFDVDDLRTAPWGHEWYLVDAAGVLQRHSAKYDTSG